MNIFLDNYSKTKQFSGVQHYAESLFEWSQEAGLGLVRVGFGKNYSTSKLVDEKAKRLPQMAANRLQRYGLLPRLNKLIIGPVNLAIFPDFVIWPVKAECKVVIFHDFTFLDRPNELSPANARYMQKQVPKSLKMADFIITTSILHKNRLITDFSINKEKVLVLPPIPDIGLLEKQKRPKERDYILSINSVEPRKNISLLLDAYVALPNNLKKNHPLVIIGKTRNTGQHIAAKITTLQKAGENIAYKGHVSNKELASYLQNAMTLINPSLEEGFGMQLLEASLLKIPVICSDIPIFKDVMSESALYFNNHETVDITNKIELMLTNEVLRKKYTKAATKNLGRFKKEDNIKALKQLLKP